MVAVSGAIERRKVVTRLLPYMLNAYWQAAELMSPIGLARTALQQYDKFEQHIADQEQTLRAMLPEIKDLKLTFDGVDTVSFSFTNEQVVDFVGDYLERQFISETGAGTSFHSQVEANGADYEFDGLLQLHYKSVYARLITEDLRPELITNYMKKGHELNPSEIWLFTLKDGTEFEVKFDPVFLSENKVVRGRLKIVALSSLFREIFVRKFRVSVSKSGDLVRLSLRK